jgi:hypothetical protein
MKAHLIKVAALGALLAALVVGGVSATAIQSLKDDRPSVRTLALDVSENMAPLPQGRFAFAKDPVHPDGLPAYGNPFITAGYIYPAGTLDGGASGVNPDGSPEFPDRVIGEWVCRGYFVGDGAKTTSGPMVITTQLYSFGDEYGESTIVLEGYELADVGKPIARAITGGTGAYRLERGEAKQTMLGLNATEGVKLRVEINLEK